MPVVALDARLLAAGVPALDAAATDHLGAALLLRFDGIGRDIAATISEPTLRWLRHVPALTVGVGPAASGQAFDLAAADPAPADAWCSAFERSPQAAHAAALLVRNAPSDPWAGLVAESAVYSMLQAGATFRTWRDTHPAHPAGDGEPRVRVAKRGRVTEIVLTRPTRHNALDVRMRDELFTALGEAAAIDGPIIVRADGPSFCSGGDLDEFGSFPDPAGAHSIRLGRSLATRMLELGSRLVVGLHGACLGAGIELPAFASTIVAADNAECGLPEAMIGLVPGAGGTVSIPARVGRARFLELLLLDGTIPANTAHEWGLVDHVVPHAQLEARVLELAEQLP